MKMTDQMERDLIEAEVTHGLANGVQQGDHFDADDFKAAAVVMSLLVFAATLLIWLG